MRHCREAIKQSNYMKRKLEKVPVTIVQTNSQSTNPISSTPSCSQDAIDSTQLPPIVNY